MNPHLFSRNRVVNGVRRSLWGHEQDWWQKNVRSRGNGVIKNYVIALFILMGIVHDEENIEWYCRGFA